PAALYPLSLHAALPIYGLAVVGDRNVLVAQAPGGARHLADAVAAVAPGRVHLEVAPDLFDGRAGGADLRVRPGPRPGPRGSRGADRKSTRLNSSHVKIS